MKKKTTWEEEGIVVMLDQVGHCYRWVWYEKLIWCFSFFSYVVVLVWLIKKKKEEPKGMNEMRFG